MSKISRCCRRLRHSSTLLWRSTCRAIIFLVVLYISQASASFPEVVNNHVEDQVSVTGGIIAESGGGREDRTLDIIGALDHTEPGEVDVAAGSGVSTFYSYAVELWILEKKLPFAKSLSRRALSAPPATPAPAPPPARSSPAPAPVKATPPTPAPAPVKTTPPTPAPGPVKTTRPPTPAPAPAKATPPPTPAPAPANATSSPTPAPTPVPRRPPAPAPTPIPAPPPTSGNSEPSSSSRGLNSKTVAGISLVVVGGVLFALFVALACFVSKRVRGKERIV